MIYTKKVFRSCFMNEAQCTICTACTCALKCFCTDQTTYKLSIQTQAVLLHADCLHRQKNWAAKPQCTFWNMDSCGILWAIQEGKKITVWGSKFSLVEINFPSVKTENAVCIQNGGALIHDQKATLPLLIRATQLTYVSSLAHLVKRAIWST